MAEREQLAVGFDGCEIGAIGGANVQWVLKSAELDERLPNVDIAVRLTAQEARFLAYALNHWAEVAEQSPVQ